MQTIRAFIAISLSSEITAQLEKVILHLKGALKDVPIRWVPPGNIHLTLKFLGNIPLEDVTALQGALQTQADKCSGFEIKLAGLGAFPNLRRPRVLWMGVDAPPELFALQQGIEDELSRLGYAREEKKFSPHLTLGRVSQNIHARDYPRINQALTQWSTEAFGSLRVAGVDLYRSDLQPSGARYTRLFSASFATT